jgi:hypothetical protein
VVASLPFAPEIVIPTIRHFARLDLGKTRLYGFKPSFNQTFALPDSPTGWWISPYQFGIDQGPVVLMIENQEFANPTVLKVHVSARARDERNREDRESNMSNPSVN